jgi:AbrB family looped-hinge helix DNA binding protein
MIFEKRIDSLGRIVLPKAIRDFLGFKEGDFLKIKVEDGKIIIYKG